MSKDAAADFDQMTQQLDQAAEELAHAEATVTKKKRSRKPKSDVPADETPVAATDPVAASSDESPDGVVTAEESDAASAQVEFDVNLLEALIFSSRHPLTAGRIGELLDVPSTKALRAAIAQLNEQYESAGRTFRIEQVAGGYQMLTLPTYGETLLKFHQKEIDSKLSRSALETLAIVAYKQPVLRAEVEAIRGVASGETIRSLMEKHLVKIAGRAEEAGRPILYGTTKRFLEVFGLNSLKELPKDDQAKPLPPHVAQPLEVTVTTTPLDEVAKHPSDADVVARTADPEEAQPV